MIVQQQPKSDFQKLRQRVLELCQQAKELGITMEWKTILDSAAQITYVSE